MLHQKIHSTAPLPPRVERRKDFYTRAIVSGLQEMAAEIERLPDSEAKVVALAAVAKYGRTLAAAIERKKRDEAELAERVRARVAAATGEKPPSDPADGPRA